MSKMAMQCQCFKYRKKKLGRYVNPKSIYWCQIHRTIQRNICQTLHKTCHLRLKPNIMTPTNLSAVKKLEQTEQNDDAKTHALIPKSNGAKFTKPSKKFKMKYMLNHASNMPLETQTQHNAAN